MDETQEYLSQALIEECLFDHLVLSHNISPDELLDMRQSIRDAHWGAFLMRSHYILHMVEKYGEYHDDEFHFTAKDFQ